MANKFEKSFLNNEHEIKDVNDKNKSAMSRRSFLKGGLAAIATLATPSIVEAGVRGLASIKPEKEKIVDISDQIRGKSEKSDLNIEVVPEYNRNLDKLLLTIEENLSDQEFDFVYGDLIKALPEYTEIEIITTKNNIPLINNKIKNHTINFLISESGDGLELWAQDYGEAIKINGQTKILLPGEINTKNTNIDESVVKDESQRLKHRNSKIINSFNKEQAVVADFVFEGGNITFDQDKQGLRVFIGFTDLHLEKGNNPKTTHKQIADNISKQFGGAEVVVMGKEVQEKPIIHIDQSFIILDDKMVLMNQFEDLSNNHQFQKIKEQHRYYQAQLKSLGYKIIPVKNNANDALNCRSSVNAIPFVDKNTGEKKVIFPVFPDELKGDFEKIEKITPDILQGKAQKAYDAFLMTGYIPIPVRDIVTHKLSGNTHCITNVLAEKRKENNKEMIG